MSIRLAVLHDSVLHDSVLHDSVLHDSVQLSFLEAPRAALMLGALRAEEHARASCDSATWLVPTSLDRKVTLAPDSSTHSSHIAIT